MSGEPAAWGVLRVGGGWVSILANEVQAETSRQSFDKTETWVHEVVPLYRHPAEPCHCVTGKTTRYCTLTPFTLTDEEREVLEHEVELAEYQQRHELAATLRGLLERLG